MLNEDKYYGVTLKLGHVSRCYYIPVTFGVIANNKKQAAKIGREIPRAKHNHKDCVLNVVEITHEEFLLINEKNNKDPFLKCKSKHEQNQLDLSDRLVFDLHYLELNKKNKKEKQKHTIYFKKDKICNPKKYAKLNNNHYMEDIDYERTNINTRSWEEPMYI